MTDKKQAHVSEEKKKIVKEFTDLINAYPVVAIVNVENLPAKQLMTMRRNLRGKAELRMTKGRLIAKALESSKKPGLAALKDHLEGMPALLVSKESPFKLFKTLKKSSSPAPIKGGQKAPKDIVVPAGGTGFAPGPIIGELGAFGIKAGIEGGKIAIKADKIVAKEGEVVNAKLAAILQRLQIFPMMIGLNVNAIYENGEILTRSILDVDEEAYIVMLQTAYTDSLKLTIARAMPIKENIDMLIQKAHRDSLGLAIAQDILLDETKSMILAKAEAQATALKEQTD
ncbi:MAG: 50S ribosomal protein L10 [Candidatus Woesearchaeota archaeon]|jgi:large subunit ribosomal protein L10